MPQRLLRPGRPRPPRTCPRLRPLVVAARRRHRPPPRPSAGPPAYLPRRLRVRGRGPPGLRRAHRRPGRGRARHARPRRTRHQVSPPPRPTTPGTRAGPPRPRSQGSEEPGGSRTSAVAITSSSPAPGDGRPALAQRGVGGGEFPGPPGHRHAGRCTQVRRLASVTEPRRGRTGPLGRRRAASRRSSGPVRSRPAARPGPGRRRARPRSAPAPTGKGTGRPHFRCLA